MNQQTKDFARLRRRALLLVFLGAGWASGCFGKSDADPNRVTLAGKVTLNGKPLPQADITFFNENDEVGMITREDGSFHIPIGALPGKYQVTISKLTGLENVPEGLAIAPTPAMNPETLPPEYSSRRRTSLTWTVPPEGSEDANFDLRTR
jgi:hypothetical protein